MGERLRDDALQLRVVLREPGGDLVRRAVAGIGDLAQRPREFPRALSEIAYARYRSADEVAAWLAEHDAELQCVVTETLPHARRADFGRAQSPSLTDYPDNRDVLAWLSAPGV